LNKINTEICGHYSESGW